MHRLKISIALRVLAILILAALLAIVPYHRGYKEGKAAQKMWASYTYDFGNVAADGNTSHTFTLAGVTTGNCWVSSNIDGQTSTDLCVKVYPSAADTITVTLHNMTSAGPVASGEITFTLVAHIEE